MYSEHYITRVQSMCAFLMMGRSLHPGSAGVEADYGLSLRERYSTHFKLDTAAGCFPVPTACMWRMMTAVIVAGSTIRPRIRTVLALSHSLFLPPFAFSPTMGSNLFSPCRMSPGS